MNVVIGSTNKTKVFAVKEVLEEYHAKVHSVDAPSGVSSQPRTDAETREGARNRAIYSLQEIEADIGIGLEGGVAESSEGLFLCNWGALVDKKGVVQFAGGARILLPNQVADEIRTGKELGHVMEAYTQKNDVRSNEGAIGIFTFGLVERKEMFIHIVRLLIGQYFFRLKDSKK